MPQDAQETQMQAILFRPFLPVIFVPFVAKSSPSRTFAGDMPLKHFATGCTRDTNAGNFVSPFFFL
ncbi:MAG: hypothetical protein WC003_17340 [Terrimicrobiaceae bacterium]